MTEPLSMAAQAVLDAYITGLATKRRDAIAAALRAVADQKSESFCTEEHGKISVIFTDDLLAIADELKAP